MKRNKLILSAGGLVLLVAFQNCGKLSSISGVDATLGTSSGDSSAATPTTTGSAVITDPCLASDVGIPTMAPSSMTTAIVLSAKGTLGGRADSSAITVGYTASNAPANKCSQGATVNCRMVSNNVTAADTSGARTAIVGNDITCSRAPATANPGSTIKVTFRANDNDTTKQCFSGTATFDISLQSNADTKKESPKQTITVTFKNNCYPEQIANDATDAFDQFGTAVAIDGTTAAVLAPGDDGAGNATSSLGAVYIYNLVGTVWTKSQVLRTEDTSIVSDRGSANDSPTALALKNGVLALGSELNNSNTGSVYVFKLASGTWSQVRRLQGPIAGGRFGKAVALDGTQLVVGAPGENSASGAVYVFDTATLTQSSRIASPLSANAYFGAAVSIDGATLAVGAPAAYLYRDTLSGDALIYSNSGTGWSEVTTNILRANAAKTGIAVKDSKGTAGTINIGLGSELGTSVLVKGSVVYVGAPGFMSGTKAVGLALVLTGTGFNTAQTLMDSSATDKGRFGTSIACSPLGVFVGAPEVRTRGGAVDQFLLNNGIYGFVRRITSDRGGDNDQFGFSVAAGGNYLVSGSKLNASPNNAQGATSLVSLVIP